MGQPTKSRTFNTVEDKNDISEKLAFGIKKFAGPDGVWESTCEMPLSFKFEDL